LRGFWICSE